MVLLQEGEQTVSFQPMTSCYVQPRWYETLFALYLLAMLLVLAIRGVRLILTLRGLRKLEKTSPEETHAWDYLWTRSSPRAQAFSKFAILTFFLSLFVLSIQAIDTISEVWVERIPSANYMLLRFAQHLPWFCFGMLVCIALYIAGFFFEARLNRRKIAFHKARCV